MSTEQGDKSKHTQDTGLSEGILIDGPADIKVKEEAKQEQEKQRREKLQLTFNGTLAITTVVLVIVGSYQACVTKQSADAASSAAYAAMSQSILSVGQLRAAQDANRLSQSNSLMADKQARAALQASINVSRRDQRAWLAILNVRLAKEPSVGETISVAYDIQNSGKTPAFQVHGSAVIGIGPTEPPKTDWKKLTLISKGTIFPNTLSKNIKIPEIIPLVVDQVAAYSSHGFNVGMRIRVDYLDVFRVAHWTESCQIHNFGEPLDSFPGCKIEGSTDDEKRANTK